MCSSILMVCLLAFFFFGKTSLNINTANTVSINVHNSDVTLHFTTYSILQRGKPEKKQVTTNFYRIKKCGGRSRWEKNKIQFGFSVSQCVTEYLNYIQIKTFKKEYSLKTTVDKRVEITQDG